MVWVGGLGPGGLDSWDPLMKGIVTWGFLEKMSLKINGWNTRLKVWFR